MLDTRARARTTQATTTADDGDAAAAAAAPPQVTVLTIYGAKPPAELLCSICVTYAAQQLQQQLTTTLVVPHFHPVDAPEAKSGDGIELLLRGFGDLASSGRALTQADFRLRGISPSSNTAVVEAGAVVSGDCYGSSVGSG